MFLIVEIVNYKGNLNNVKCKGRYLIFSVYKMYLLNQRVKRTQIVNGHIYIKNTV